MKPGDAPKTKDVALYMNLGLVDNPLLTAKNCFITPHVAWATLEARIRLMHIAVGNLKSFIDGKVINNVAI